MIMIHMIIILYDNRLAPSDPAVRCDDTIKCIGSGPESVDLERPFNYDAIKPCNISVLVHHQSNSEILDQLSFINVKPLISGNRKCLHTKQK